ncbi:hypothetical protein ANN_23658 [Periplaneta americana]|uniref:Uncharacterized protein n=1 Tax=Periplaneta americana TaxID=6978 RepID=A0ABQ8SM57_PERAM|nr:hypothetical protein ANN_23658 [Periplaneta americana]
MAGLCEGGNEPPGSLKASKTALKACDLLLGAILSMQLWHPVLTKSTRTATLLRLSVNMPPPQIDDIRSKFICLHSDAYPRQLTPVSEFRNHVYHNLLVDLKLL